MQAIAREFNLSETVFLRDAGDPVECARAYDAQGADELVFLDITASHEGRATMREVARVLGAGGDETALYERATDVLVALHQAPEHGLLPGLGAYLGEGLIDAAMLLPEWYLPEASGKPVPDEEIDSYRMAWRQCLAHLPAGGDTLLLRDYHKDNLLWLPARPGVKACGLLDFQDAQRGHPSYDLVSLIEDARRDVAPAAYEIGRASCRERV